MPQDNVHQMVKQIFAAPIQLKIRLADGFPKQTFAAKGTKKSLSLKALKTLRFLMFIAVLQVLSWAPLLFGKTADDLNSRTVSAQNPAVSRKVKFPHTVRF